MKLARSISSKLTYLALIGLAGLPAFAHAGAFDSSNISISGGTAINNNSDGVSLFKNIASSVLTIILSVVGVVAVFYLVWSGFQYVTAGGNADKVKAARQGIINAVIGIIIIMAAFLIVRLAVGLGQSASKLGS